MTEQSSTPYHLQISETIGEFLEVYLSPGSDELFIVGYSGIVTISLSTETLIRHVISPQCTVVGQQQGPDGWQCVIHENSTLVNRRLIGDTYSDTLLDTPIESPYTASWSHCGQYVAVGSTGTSLSVWDTRTGELVLRKYISWGEGEEELLTSPTLSVRGWLSAELKFVTVAEYLAASTVMVWDLETQGLTAHIE
jgi:WD40 repeat protein